MRGIGSNRTTGPEAILMSTINWWAKNHKFEKHITDHLNKLDTRKFRTKNEFRLGQILQETGFPLEKVQENFWQYAKNNPVLKFMVEQATIAQKENDRVGVSKRFVNTYIQEHLGSIVKSHLRT